MANIIIPKKIQQTLINTVFKHGSEYQKETLDWNYNRKPKGKNTLDYIWLPTPYPVHRVTPLDENEKMFCPQLSVVQCIPVWMPKRNNYFRHKDTKAIFRFESLGFSNIDDFMLTYDLKKKEDATGILLMLFNNKKEVEHYSEKTKSPIINFTKEQYERRYVVAASIIDGYVGSQRELCKKVAVALNDAGLTNRHMEQYTSEQAITFVQSVPILRRIKKKPVYPNKRYKG